MTTDQSDVEVRFRDAETSPEVSTAAQDSVTAMVSVEEERRRAEAERDAAWEEATRSTIEEPASDGINVPDPVAPPEIGELGGPAVEVPLMADVIVPRGTGWSNFISANPPFDYDWKWHAGGAPRTLTTTRSSGYAGADCRSGSGAGGGDGPSIGHAGFGIVRTAPFRFFMSAGAVISARWHYSVAANGIGSSATAEGGYTLYVFEDGRVVASTSVKLFRKRVSFQERDTVSTGYQTITTSRVAFTMLPGRLYGFNLGIWASAERSSGVGAAAAQGLVEGNVSTMTMVGPSM
ncbi:hypothetical protein [Actinomycetospora aeridis]|uniref:Minor tail protein n=1 Tax=Actinomycetospora aeridis TaxID=3129231 RepID=A0ABU8NA63_9PSEU